MYLLTALLETRACQRLSVKKTATMKIASHMGRDSFSDVSESSSSESFDDDLFNDINHLQISCDEDFINHDLEDINDHDTTSIEEVDMDVSSTTTCGRIETNILVMPAANRELLMEGVDQSVRLLSPGYECVNSSELKQELNIVEEKNVYLQYFQVEGTV